MNIYIILATAWVFLSLGIGSYINGIGLSDRIHYKVGLVTIGLSYVIGIALLIAIIVHH